MRRLFLVFISIGALLIPAGTAVSGSAAQTPSGYWKYASYGIAPRPEEAPKAMPGRLLEQKATGNLDVAAGAVRHDCVWNTDDVDRRPYTMQSGFVLNADKTLSVLVPGEKVLLKGSAGVSGNGLAAALPSDASFTAGVDNWDAFQIAQLPIGRKGTGQQTMTVPNGGPGGSMVVWLSSHLGSFGAFGSTMRLYYQWVEGPPPSGAALDAKAGGVGTPEAKITDGGTSAASQSGTTPAGSGNAGGTAGGGATSAEMALRADAIKVKTGETVLLPVFLDNSSGLANMNFNIVYEARVAEAGNPVKGALLSAQTLMVPNAGAAGLVRIGLAGKEDIRGSGVMVQIPFKAVGAPGTATELKLAVTTIRSAAGGTPSIKTINGRIEILGADASGGTTAAPGTTGAGGAKPAPPVATTPPAANPSPAGGAIPGDANGNGVLEAVDALMALKMSVGLIPEAMVCDIDKDGRVTSTDARLILSKAVGK
jgi:hypothetical protein